MTENDIKEKMKDQEPKEGINPPWAEDYKSSLGSGLYRKFKGKRTVFITTHTSTTDPIEKEMVDAAVKKLEDDGVTVIIFPDTVTYQHFVC